ncbi:ribosomal RNA processing protein 36 [Histomonas meleagridis]|uniref:ribosomal RNA processing protein 36-like n=1 Tax=Histomonas meleagridis TaxID=135588 RepID=UPI00355A22DB|nr:ribosomal RNA processing protein 36 [Histomonas meleagridis]KAH0801237.1 ribosomal RNA processing protein 36-like [Histomonas meleagridis]
MKKSKDKEEQKKQKKQKGGPQEMTTSKPGGAYSFLNTQNLPKYFDPRFSEQCGEMDKIGFVKNYSFLQQNREREIKEITNAMKNSDNSTDLAALKRQRQSLVDQQKTFDTKIKDVEERIRWHRDEKQRILEGKKPFWLDKKAMREMAEQKKFNQLKQSGKLQKYLAKKRKKQAAKDKKFGLGAGGIF